MPNNAAKSTRMSDGNMNVIVCAGYQKQGMVFLNTKFHWAFQFNSVMIFVIGIGVNRLLIDPPHIKICVSVILWKVMNTGAKMVFMVTDMKSEAKRS